MQSRQSLTHRRQNATGGAGAHHQRHRYHAAHRQGRLATCQGRRSAACRCRI